MSLIVNHSIYQKSETTFFSQTFALLLGLTFRFSKFNHLPTQNVILNLAYIHQNTLSVLGVKMNICKFLNTIILFHTPILVYKSAFTCFLTLLVKKLQMVKNRTKS